MSKTLRPASIKFRPDGKVKVSALSAPGSTSLRTADPLSAWFTASPYKGLFYADQGNRLMTVPVATSGPRVGPGTPVALFSLPQGATYQASPDGQRFLISDVPPVLSRSAQRTGPHWSLGVYRSGIRST